MHSMKRPREHVAAFALAELGANGSPVCDGRGGDGDG